MITLVGSEPAPRDRSILDAALRGAGLRPESTPVMIDPNSVHSSLDAISYLRLSDLIVALGDAAAESLLGDQWPRDKRGKPEGERQIRGYLWDTEYGRVLTTVEPAVAQKEWVPFRVLLDLDMRKAAKEARDGCPALAERTVHIVEDKNELDDLWKVIERKLQGNVEGCGEALNRKGAENDGLETLSDVPGNSDATKSNDPGTSGNRLRLSGSIGLDTPRTARSTHGSPQRTQDVHAEHWIAVDIENDDVGLSCLGVAPTTDEAWVIPARDWWQCEAIKRICEAGLPLVLQNGSYDQTYLRLHNRIMLRDRVFDTMLGWHALQPELAGAAMHGRRRTVKSLRFLASIYTRDRFWKNYDFADEGERYHLCGVDCCSTLEIALAMEAQLVA